MWLFKAKHHGKVISRRLGDAEGPAGLTLARARELSNQARFGDALANVKRRRAGVLGVTGQELFDAWLATASEKLARMTIYNLTGIWHRAFQGDYGRRDAGNLFANAVALVTEAKARGPSAGNLAYTLVGHLHRVARAQGLTRDPNPLRDQPDLRSKTPPRDIAVTDALVADIVRGLEAVKPYWQTLFMFCALSGKRIGNCKSLRWEQVDLSGGVVAWPGSEVKNRQAIATPITQGIRKILEERRKAVPMDCPFVWPSSKRRGRPCKNHENAWVAVRAASGRPGLVCHHLRHVATTAAIRGAGSARAKALTGHRSDASLRIYTHLDTSDALPAAEAVERVWARARRAATRGKIGKPAARKGGSRGKTR